MVRVVPVTREWAEALAHGAEATFVVRELVGRAREADLRTVFAHILAEESASTTVLKRSAFENVGELVDPVDGPIWRWELQLAGMRGAGRGLKTM